MQHVHLAIEEGVATVTLSYPGRKNALGKVMKAELAETLEQLRRDPQVRALLLTGAGGAFCSGSDISAMGKTGEAEARAAMRDMHRVWGALADSTAR